jgi:hypothetical protein
VRRLFRRPATACLPPGAIKEQQCVQRFASPTLLPPTILYLLSRLRWGLLRGCGCRGRKRIAASLLCLANAAVAGLQVSRNFLQVERIRRREEHKQREAPGRCALQRFGQRGMGLQVFTVAPPPQHLHPSHAFVQHRHCGQSLPAGNDRVKSVGSGMQADVAAQSDPSSLLLMRMLQHNDPASEGQRLRWQGGAQADGIGSPAIQERKREGNKQRGAGGDRTAVPLRAAALSAVIGRDVELAMGLKASEEPWGCSPTYSQRSQSLFGRRVVIE